MDSVVICLKNGDKVTLQDINFEKLVENINNFKGDKPTFITFKDSIFVVENIEYIKKN